MERRTSTSRRWAHRGHCMGGGGLFVILLYLLFGALYYGCVLFLPVYIAYRCIKGFFVWAILDDSGKPKGTTPIIVGSDPVETYQYLLPAADEMTIVETAAEVTARCPVCAEEAAGDLVTCPRCDTPHHRDCWEYVEGCAIFGCGTSSAQVASTGDSRAFHASEFGKLHQRFRRWFWLLRVKWWLELGFWSWLAMYLGVLHVFSDKGSVVGIVGQVSAVALAVYGLFWVVIGRSLSGLESSLGRRIEAPPGRVERLVRRLDHSQSRPLLEGAARVAPVLYCAFVLPPLISAFFLSGRGAPPVVDIGFLILGGGAALVLPWITKRHQARLEAVRWRLHATLRAVLPPRSEKG